MSATRFIDHVLGPDTHTNRPAASACPWGTMYVCSTHNMIERNNSGTWGDWASLSGSSAAVLTTKGDLLTRDGTALARLAVGTDGQVLTADSTQADGIKWATAGGGGSTYPPAGSADKHPATPNAKDDEFDGTSSVSWTSTPTAPNAFDINTTRADHAYVKGTGAAPFEGKYQAVPGSYPFTATLKVASSTARGNYHRAGGLILGPAAPVGTSALVYLGSVYDTGNHGAPARGVNRTTETFAGTFASAASFRPFIGHWAALYLRIRVNSATSIDTFASNDGYAWVPIDSAYNPGFTPGVMGFACNDANAGGGVEAYFDWFRIT